MLTVIGAFHKMRDIPLTAQSEGEIDPSYLIGGISLVDSISGQDC
jgi:hypothetical protein